jgi:hypothetical protein
MSYTLQFMMVEPPGLKHADLTEKIIAVFYDVYNELGESARALDPAHEAHLLHYLKSTSVEIGLLLNFGIRPQFRRLTFDNLRKKIRENPCKSVAGASA